MTPENKGKCCLLSSEPDLLSGITVGGFSSQVQPIVSPLSGRLSTPRIKGMESNFVGSDFSGEGDVGMLGDWLR
jgi:hypothetical protein